MEHWFDHLTRNVARQSRTRRSALTWAARLGIAAAGVGLFGRSAPDSQAREFGAQPDDLAGGRVNALAAAPAAAPAAASCSVEDTYGVLSSLTVTSSSGVLPMTLTHRFVTEVGSGMTSSTLTVVPGVMNGATPRVAPTLKMSVAAAVAGAASADVQFGALYTGTTPRRSSFSTDGSSVRGFVDGKATAPAALGAGPNTIRFTDGRPVIDSAPGPATPTPTPTPSPTPTPQRSVRDGQNEGGMAPGAPASPRPGSGNEQHITPPSGTLTPAGAVAVQRAISGLLQQAQRDASTCSARIDPALPTARCTTCQMSCRSAWVHCSVSAVQGSLTAGALAPNAYLATANGTCDRALQQCFSACKSSGGCCPSHCNGDATCCQSAWGCCRPGQAPTSKKWSTAWPTCPRCGPPVSTSTNSRIAAR